jgi:hypothetical protein
MKYIVKHNNIILEKTDDCIAPVKHLSLLYPNAKYVSLIVDENKLLDDSFDEGLFIISDIKVTKLVRKEKKTIYGFIYNSYEYVIRIIDTMYLEETIDTHIFNQIGVYCMGNQYDKIEEIINNSIIDKNVREENIYIISDNLNAWTFKYPLSFVYDVLDEEVLHAIVPPDFDIMNNTSNIKRMLVFDNCLTYKNIKNNKFIELLDNYIKKNISIIVITNDNNINEISLKFTYIINNI